MRSHPWRRMLATAAVLTTMLTTACGGAPETGVAVSGVALAGPVCPVETNPPDPACAPRPVVDAIVQAVADSGDVVESTTGSDGRFSFVLPPGRYEIIAQPAEGLMGTAASIEVEVLSEPVDVGVLMYDTGIR